MMFGIYVYTTYIKMLAMVKATEIQKLFVKTKFSYNSFFP